MEKWAQNNNKEMQKDKVSDTYDTETQMNHKTTENSCRGRKNNHKQMQNHNKSAQRRRETKKGKCNKNLKQ